MKVDVTHCNIINPQGGGVAATVQKVDEVCIDQKDARVRVEINHSLGWTDWLYLTDAVRRAMLLMEVTQP